MCVTREGMGPAAWAGAQAEACRQKASGRRGRHMAAACAQGVSARPQLESRGSMAQASRRVSDHVHEQPCPVSGEPVQMTPCCPRWRWRRRRRSGGACPRPTQSLPISAAGAISYTAARHAGAARERLSSCGGEAWQRPLGPSPPAAMEAAASPSSDTATPSTSVHAADDLPVAPAPRVSGSVRAPAARQGVGRAAWGAGTPSRAARSQEEQEASSLPLAWAASPAPSTARHAPSAGEASSQAPPGQGQPPARRRHPPRRRLRSQAAGHLPGLPCKH